LAFAAHAPSRHGRHSVEASCRLVRWSRSLSGTRRTLGFVKDDDDDLIDAGEDEDVQTWVPSRDVLHRWRRNEGGRLVYPLWSIKPIRGLTRTSVTMHTGLTTRSGGGQTTEMTVARLFWPDEA
jgi:hypothetical protein